MGVKVRFLVRSGRCYRGSALLRTKSNKKSHCQSKTKVFVSIIIGDVGIIG